MLHKIHEFAHQNSRFAIQNQHDISTQMYLFKNADMQQIVPPSTFDLIFFLNNNDWLYNLIFRLLHVLHNTINNILLKNCMYIYNSKTVRKVFIKHAPNPPPPPPLGVTCNT